MKKVLLTVGSGTACTEAVQSSIVPVENALRNAFPDYEIRRAFTSRGILRKLNAQGMTAESETEALSRLHAEGISDIRIASTHIIPGHEYDRLRAAAGQIPLSSPLLSDDDDLDRMAGLLNSVAASGGRPLLLMGHGTDHSSNEIYARLRGRLPETVFIACTAGPFTLEPLLPALNSLPQRSITLMPLMLAAGNHARRDLAGSSDASWKSVLEAAGFDVRVRMEGLGSMPEVQQLFVDKVRRILR